MLGVVFVISFLAVAVLVIATFLGPFLFGR